MAKSIAARLDRIEVRLAAGRGRHVLIFTEQDGYTVEHGPRGHLTLRVPGAPGDDQDGVDLLNDEQRALVGPNDNVVTVCYDKVPPHIAGRGGDPPDAREGA
jgi:hypothetical protein